MPPKKKEEEKPRALLGRPGNNVKAGLVGLPNVGKSTTFNMMCKMSVPAENFPFCTIDPTESRVQVPDPQFTELIGAFKPKSEVPAVLTVFDIAGLVKGASEGAGLGNAFLSHISATDALFHICRTYEETADGDVATHVEDTVDPVRDLEIIANELLQKDIAFVESQRGPLAKEVGRDGKAKDKKDKLAATDKILEWIKSGKDARFGQWSSKEVDVLNEYNLLTSKPALYLVNMSEKDFLRKKNKHLPKLHAWLTENRPGEKMIPYSAAMEAKLLEMEAAEKAAFLEESKAASQMDKIVVEGCARDLVGRSSGAILARLGAILTAHPHLQVPHAAADPLLHVRRRRGQVLDDQEGVEGAAGGGDDPHRLRARVHQGGGLLVRRLEEPGRGGQGEGGGEVPHRGEGVRRQRRRRHLLQVQRHRRGKEEVGS